LFPLFKAGQRRIRGRWPVSNGGEGCGLELAVAGWSPGSVTQADGALAAIYLKRAARAACCVLA